MSHVIDITGQRYGFLVALKRIGSRRIGQRHYDSLWLFRCDCGVEKEIKLTAVRSGDTYSCGCWADELRHSANNLAQLERTQPEAAAAVTTHHKSRTVVYHAWQAMKQVCTNPNNRGYPYYGGRGIELRYPNFEALYADVGDRLRADMWLSRFDKTGHYEPGNVGWQVRPRRKRRRRKAQPATSTLRLKQTEKNKNEAIMDTTEKAKEQLDQATTAMITAARKFALSNSPLMNTPVGRLTDDQWSWLCTASLFAWIRCRNEQAIGANCDAEKLICDTGLDPSPINTVIVTSILPKLSETANIDWMLPLMAWSKNQMISFLLKAWKLIEQAEIIAAHNQNGVLRKADGKLDGGGDDLTDLPFEQRRSTS